MIDVTPNRVNQIIAGKRSIAGNTALRFGHWLGTDPQFWPDLQIQFDYAVPGRRLSGGGRAVGSSRTNVHWISQPFREMVVGMPTQLPPTCEDLDEVPVISARDPEVPGFFPEGFRELYEVYSYRSALHVLSHACKQEFDQIIDTLMGFRISTIDMVTPGGNKSKIAIAMEKLLKPLDWNETRIVADLEITRITRLREPYTLRSGKNKGDTKYRSRENRERYRIPSFVAGHKVDFVKGRVAFDMEWNSKDQTFDRDLNAVRALYECNIVAAGVLLTRSAELVPLFQEIQNRVEIDKFASKYGASTTWMKGGCPVLVIGIKPAVVSDFEDWKNAHPAKRNVSFAIDGPVEETDEC